ncbi:UNKNOWN [Stylonychia lemnae]|uniref:Uncharacterized protein n=1 Tax=Stylonychia lemnae TaxID=5949 RepID=A0A078B303_STYLE|nr:UNKNOWN [Stylonychia lemnae]|eukprot:CDW88641.1 UNKNOWN [Stylonychia lemnae]
MEQQLTDQLKNISGTVRLAQTNDTNGILSFDFQVPKIQFKEQQEVRVKNSQLIVVLDASLNVERTQFQVIKDKLKVFLKFYQKENPDKPNPHILICNEQMIIVRDQYEAALDKVLLKNNLDILNPLKYIQEESNKSVNSELNLMFILQSLNYLDDKAEDLIEKISMSIKNNFKYCCVQLLIISDDCSDKCGLDILHMGTVQGKFLVVPNIISKLYHDDIIYKDLFEEKLYKFMSESFYHTRIKNNAKRNLANDILLSENWIELQILQNELKIRRESAKQKYQQFIDLITQQMKASNQQLHIEEVYKTNDAQESIISVNLVSLYRNFMTELKQAQVNNSGNEEQKEEDKQIPRQDVEELQEDIQVMRQKELENAEVINKKDQLILEFKKQLEDLQIRLRELQKRELEDQILPSILQQLDRQPRQRQDQIKQQQSVMKVAKIAQQQKAYKKDNYTDIDLESQNSDRDFKMPKVNPKLDLVNGKYGKKDIYKKTPQDEFVTDDYDVTRILQPRLANIVSSQKEQLSRYICRNKKQSQIVKDCVKEFKMINQESEKLIKKETWQANIINGQYRGLLSIFTFTNK